MKIIRLLLILFTLPCVHTMAQVTISLGVWTGAGSTNVLLSTSTTTNRYSRTISLYSANEIIAAGGMAGFITSLGWDKSGTGEYTTNDAYIKIFLKHHTDTAWSTSPVPVWDTEVIGATEVFTSSTYSIPTGIGWITVPFTTPFVWNGVDNIAVFVEWDRSSTPTAAINWGRSTNTNANASRVGSTSLAALIMLVNSNRPLLQLTITPGSVTPIDSVIVATQGNVPPVITTNGGTLQMEASVFPANAYQNVNWSVINVTGFASISNAGLVTAYFNGTVWAKAVSVQDSTKADSLLITISNQVIPIVSLTVTTQGGVAAAITTAQGSLQLEATILPVNALQDVTWSIINLTGTATISQTGLVTAQTDGTVWAKAVSVQDITKKDSIAITITNQSVGMLSNPKEQTFNIYPNPVNGGIVFVELGIGQVGNNAYLEILDVLGQLIRTEKVKATKLSIPLKGLPSGVYVMRYQDGSLLMSRKFIIE